MHKSVVALERLKAKNSIKMISYTQVALLTFLVAVMMVVQGCGSSMQTTTAAPATTTRAPSMAQCAQGVMSCGSSFDPVRCAGLTAACVSDYDFTCSIDSNLVKNAMVTVKNIRANLMPVIQSCATEMPSSTSNYDLSFTCNMPLISCKGGDIAWCTGLGAWCVAGVPPFSCAIQGGSTTGVCTGCNGAGLQNMCNRNTPSPPFLPPTYRYSLSMWTTNTCTGSWTGQTSGPGPMCQSASGASASLIGTCWNGGPAVFVCSDTRCGSCTNMVPYALAGACFNGPDSVYPPPYFFQAKMLAASSSACGSSVSERRPLPTALLVGLSPPVNVDDAWEATTSDVAISV